MHSNLISKTEILSNPTGGLIYVLSKNIANLKLDGDVVNCCNQVKSLINKICKSCHTYFHIFLPGIDDGSDEVAQDSSPFHFVTILGGKYWD